MNWGRILVIHKKQIQMEKVNSQRQRWESIEKGNHVCSGKCYEPLSLWFFKYTSFATVLENK